MDREKESRLNDTDHRLLEGGRERRRPPPIPTDQTGYPLFQIVNNKIFHPFLMNGKGETSEERNGPRESRKLQQNNKGHFIEMDTDLS